MYYSWSEYKQDIGLEHFFGERSTDKPSFLEYVRLAVTLAGMSLISKPLCRIKGHDVECESYANSETGSESFYCRRFGCDWSHTHIYY